MVNETLKPDGEYATEIRRCTKRIITARVMIFVISGLILALACFVIWVGVAMYSDGMFIMPAIKLAGIGLLFLFLGLFSLFRPFVPLLIASVISVAGFAWWLTGFFDYTSMNELLIEGFGVDFVQIILIWFIIRGAVYAYRKEKLVATVD